MTDFETRLASYICKTLTHDGDDGRVSSPPQGMSSNVFFLTLAGEEYAVKYGKDATKDVPAIALMRARGVHVPVPEVISSFEFDEVPVLVMRRITFPLLEDVSAADLPMYIPSMLDVMEELHTITNSMPQVVSGSRMIASWKDYLLAQFDGRTIDWEEVLKRKALDHALVRDALDRFCALLVASEIEPASYALLHTDFNQRNLFVDPATKTISGVIDWEDAIFGDPIYDFARVRMFIWHFALPDTAVAAYYDRLNYTDEERWREWLYWTARVIQYLAWYSEEETPFNASRIALHQDYLRGIRW